MTEHRARGAYISHTQGESALYRLALASLTYLSVFFFFSSRRRHTRFDCDWSSDVCSSDLAAEKLAYLRDTGITLIEVMPVAEFPGRFGWGYDGVQPYAPASLYGTPQDMQIGRASCRERG